MKTVRKTSIFPVPRDVVIKKLQQLETLQYIASPYASFVPLDNRESFIWTVGSTSSYRLKLFGVIPFGIHTIKIERFDEETVRSSEGNRFVQLWIHKIYLKNNGTQTEYTDEVDIDAGWKTIFVWLWAKSFYSHRQRRWLKLLKSDLLVK